MQSRFIFFLILLFWMCITGCQTRAVDKRETAIQEINQAEKDFEKMVAEKGVAEGFSHYADSNAVILQGGDSLIFGKTGIRHFFSGERFKNVSVNWSPDHTDAAASGELGYTYGKYTWRSADSTGKVTESTGIFHTVWKKQKDGSWKFLWD